MSTTPGKKDNPSSPQPDRMDISIVVPCYNEEEALPASLAVLASLLVDLQQEGLVGSGSELIFVDDGSHDATWRIIQNAASGNAAIKGVRLAGNRGHQNALLAGMQTALGDYVVTIDADLQDDVTVIREMVQAAGSGVDIICGIRKNRESDTFFKRFSAQGFYRLMRFFGVNLIYNHADFRCMSRRAVASLLQYTEVNLFLRGIITELGYNTMLVYYDRKERSAGVTKYPLRKMLLFAWEGITSFSTFPLSFLALAGIFLALSGFVIMLWALYVRFALHTALPGWTSTILPVVFFSGVQLIGLSVIGGYVAKIYMEVKRRPRFFIADTTDNAKMRDTKVEDDV